MIYPLHMKLISCYVPYYNDDTFCILYQKHRKQLMRFYSWSLEDRIHHSSTTAFSLPYALTMSRPSCYKNLPYSVTYTTHSLTVYIFIYNNELLP